MNGHLSGSSGQYVKQGEVFEVDFGAPITVGGMGLKFSVWYRAVDDIYDIQLSNDKTNWIDVQGSICSGDTNTYQVFNKPRTFRYMRFTFGKPSYSASYTPLLQSVTFWNI